MNFLEQLAAEWYEYSGYFVRTNVRARKRSRGGWEIELDVLAFSPSKSELIHVETSSDADAWTDRKRRFLTKKFVLGQSEYEDLIGNSIATVRRVAIVGWAQKTKSNLNWGKGIEVLLIPNFLAQIVAELRRHDFMKEAVPEGYPILRTIQMLLTYGPQAT